jgi:hypothetical protein
MTEIIVITARPAASGRSLPTRWRGSATLSCEYLDAPVSGGEVGAKAASLTIMVGGSPSAFEKVRPLFELMGKNITRVGSTESFTRAICRRQQSCSNESSLPAH